ncbi:2-oxoacid dehydrogenases acyltransferase family protein [Orientia tsutsugamushi str. TA716]|uniref:2-oxoacid dehydrogenases acyltransferase family protein n=1 Tax=Orientia tsutsugamushi str. TA716 TaxID=1359175 RepID=A0A0F3P7N5_ORITS|nr:2-oxoacid dehydrogenases acyltransferase family protein [Orientia tsutsugamushi str. TA716]
MGARANKLKPSEFQGSSFTISNLGMYCIKQFNAIINLPQSCILSIRDAIKMPVVVDNQITVARIIDISLSCDHRVVDGIVGAKFLNIFREIIENPMIMLV